MRYTNYSLSIIVLLFGLSACDKTPDTAKESNVPAATETAAAKSELPNTITFHSPMQYPEGIEWDASQNRFLVTSIRKGEVGAVTDDGSYSTFATDPRMICSVGIQLDPARDRMLVCNSDGGAGEKSSKETTGKVAALAAFRLSTGELISYTDLAPLVDGGHFCNDIAIAPDGTAYITDSFSPVIYKVDTNYKASVLIKNDAFTGAAFNLNGIVIKDNFLLVDKMNSGQLFKIPLDNPEAFSEVKISENLEGADGLLWAPDGSLIVVGSNNAHVGIAASKNALNAIVRLKSDDNWQSATIAGKADTGDVFASTATLRDGQIYATHAMLHVLFNPETKEHKQDFDIVKYNP